MKRIKFFLQKTEHYILWVILVALTVFSYRAIPLTYYMNDELLHIGYLRMYGLSHLIQSWTVIDIISGRVRPLGTLVTSIFFTYFPNQTLPFAYFVYIFHPLNGLLCYLITKKISNNRFISVFSSIFFVVSTVSFQALVWSGANIQIVGSTFFVLLSFYLYLLFIDSKRRIYAIVSWFFVYVAFLLKDSSISAVAILPMLSMFYGKKKVSFLDILKKYWFLALFVIGLILYRLKLLMGTQVSALDFSFDSTIIQRSLLFVFNTFFYPIVSLPHFVIPFRFLYKLADSAGFFLYPYLSTNVYAELHSVISQTIISDFISVCFAFVIISSLVFIYMKNPRYRYTMIFALCFYFFCMFPISIYLERRNSSYIESRYLYMQSWAAGILFGIIADNIYRKLKEFRFKGRKILILLFIIFVAAFFYKQTTIIQREVYENVLQGQEVKHIFNQLNIQYPTFPNNPIIFLDGDRFWYYPHIKIPVQLSPGYIFFLHYMDIHEVSPQVFEESFWLWQIYTQWYKHSNGEGFGYFWSKESLKQAFEKDASLRPEQILGLYYDSNTRTFRDISAGIQNYVLQKE